MNEPAQSQPADDRSQMVVVLAGDPIRKTRSMCFHDSQVVEAGSSLRLHGQAWVRMANQIWS
jgi:putative AlgH/UPF0301 family transcriptional regulator